MNNREKDNKEALADRLQQGLRDLDLNLGSHQQEQLLQYQSLLQHWNRAYNLTAVTDSLEMVERHLLDSLSIIPFLQGRSFIDVGTGPGLPGIPLAIALPEKQFTLLDSNGKKARFLFQVRASLGLKNVREVQSRVESFNPPALYDAVISRAFSSLSNMVDVCVHLLVPGGRFYAMKGRYPERELSELAKPYNVCASHALHIPGVIGERHLIEIGLTT